MSSGLSPVVLFVYSRPDHTRRTLESLAANYLADESDLVVYADAASDATDVGRVNAVRQLVRSATGFRSVTVVERQTNYGLARNIIKGVTEVCNRYGRVIVLEDDIVTSPYFLSFMNAALDRYVDEPRVYHISGWNYPIDSTGLGDAFFWRGMNCWGWATWESRWKHFEKNASKEVLNWSRKQMFVFNLDGAQNIWGQVVKNYCGQINTWAVYWYIVIFRNNGLCLNPTKSLAMNIGNDGSGIHGKQNPVYMNALAVDETIEFYSVSMSENYTALTRIKRLYSEREALIFRIFGYWPYNKIRVFICGLRRSISNFRHGAGDAS